MTWKLKILNIKTLLNDFNNIHIYFALFKLNPTTGEFEKMDTRQVRVKSSDLKSKTKPQKESFIKDLIKTEVQPLIDTFENNEELKSIIGYEEIL